MGRAEVAIAEAPGAQREELGAVGGGQKGPAAAARNPHVLFGPLVVREEILEGQRPVDQGRAVDGAVGGARAELVGEEAERLGLPVHGAAADGLADVGGLLGPSLGDARIAGDDAPVLPREHRIGRRLVVLEIGEAEARARLQDHDVDALLAELVRQRPAAGAGADDDENAVVVVLEGNGSDFVLESLRRHVPTRRTRPPGPCCG